jgi:glutathione S-transferase
MNKNDIDLGRYPILYSFRRCPYAIRARFAIVLSGVKVELREIVLRDKPTEFLQESLSATVPCLVTKGKVFDESLDIMKWAFEINDPEHFLNMPLDGYDLIKHSDGPFKDALDRVKYASRYPSDLFDESRQRAEEFQKLLNKQLCQPYLFGPRPTLADIAIFPFVRQFAFIDKAWFDNQKWLNLSTWLDTYLKSPTFEITQQKFPKWIKGNSVISFP